MKAESYLPGRIGGRSQFVAAGGCRYYVLRYTADSYTVYPAGWGVSRTGGRAATLDTIARLLAG